MSAERLPEVCERVKTVSEFLKAYDSRSRVIHIMLLSENGACSLSS